MDVPQTSHSSTEPSMPAYLQIKNFVLEKIQSGQWREGDLIPTELALCEQFGVSRMTVNRALRELTNDELLVRIKGSGTYVAQPKFQSTLIEIRSIAQDIRERGHQHSCQVLSMERLHASPSQARLIEVLVPPTGIAQALHMKEQQPCLVMDRRTFSSDQFTTHARLWHPGDRYKFTGKM
uniref:HTH gntR-type domain-containing protein n=1 Tax=Steinernema glaseri TaxID=37863 RepID=A0A1I7YHE2_9BILA